MKLSIFIIVILIVCTGCNLFSTDDTMDKGNCNEELFERINEVEFIRVIVDYDIDMELESLDQMSEEEIQARKDQIAEYHDKLLSTMEGLKFQILSKSEINPWIALSVNEESMMFLCHSNMVINVSESNRGTTF